MDHQTALSSQAVERYTLDELTSPQREAFEEHFFTCPDCAQALREYQIFAANTRAVFEEEAQRKPVAAPPAAAQPGWWQGWRTWFGAPIWVPAMSLVLAFFLFQAPALTEEWEIMPMSRGAVQKHMAPRDAKFFAPSIRLQGMDPARWQSYRWELSGVDGKTVENGRGRENPLKLHISSSKVVPGATYILTVRGDRDNDSQKPLESNFAIDYK